MSINKCGDNLETAGNTGGKLGSIHFDVGLGAGTNALGTGALMFYGESAATNLATPQNLVLTSSPDFHSIKDVNGLRQILSRQLLADIVTNTPFDFQVRLLKATDAGIFTNGLYQPTGTPVKTVSFRNPDGATNCNRLWVTVADNAATNTYEYTWAADSTTYSNSWELVYPSSIRRDVLSTVWNTNSVNHTTLLSVYTPGNPDSLVYQEQKSYVDYGWGDVVVEQVTGPDGPQLTNRWQYYTNSADTGSYGRLKMKTTASGYWEQYVYDNLGRETNRTFAFLSASNGSPASLCRSIATLYSSSVPNITRIGKVLDQEVSRSYTAIYAASNCVKTIQCQSAGASWTNTANLVTVMSRDSFSRPTNILYPDGTKAFYSYVTNADKSVKTTFTSGQANSGGSAVAEGTKNITLVGSAGQMVSNIVMNIAGSTDGAILQQDSYSYTSDDYAFQSPTVNHLDGTQTSASTGCCGAQQSGNTIDKDGTTTYFTYDALGHRTSATVNGVMTTNILDGWGNVLAAVRVGTNGSVIFDRLASYDTAGQLLSAANALSGTTTYTNALDTDGGLIKTSVNPDGGTRIESYYRDGTMRSITGSATQPVRYEYGVEQDQGQYRLYQKEIKLDADGNDSAKWIKTYRDMLDRTCKVVYSSSSGTPSSISYYNVKGQLTNQLDADSVSTLYLYGAKGQRTSTVVDVNTNYTIDYTGSDRITFVTNDVVSDYGTTVQRTRTFVWSTSSNASNLVSTTETSADGLRTWNTVWNNSAPVTSQNMTTYIPANGLRIVTITAPDNSYTVTTNQYGRPISITSYDTNNIQLSQMTYGFDEFGRQNTITDARTGTTTVYFNDADQVSGILTPVPSQGQSAQISTNYFDNMGRIWKTTLPDSTSITNEYYASGLLKKTYGSRTYPVFYDYDSQSRLRTMKTWKDFAADSGCATTTWNYDLYRGWLTNKTYDGATTGPFYSYTPGGRLVSRTWARGITTTYAYSTAGDLLRVSYSDATPEVSYGYDRRGRQTTVTNATSLFATLAYNDANQVLAETFSSGPLAGYSVTNGYDALLRRTALALGNEPTTLVQFGYDAASRLATVTNGVNSVNYAYLANSALLQYVTFVHNGSTRMTTTRVHDDLNRLASVQNSAGGSMVASFDYTYNTASQRTALTNIDNSRWLYTYDGLGQVISGRKTWSDGTPVAGQQFEYSFDDIGNRLWTAAGGDTMCANLRTAFYTNNLLNQITRRDVPGYVNVMGSANSNATVVLWGGDGSYALTTRKGDYYWGELGVNNSTGTLWLAASSLAALNDGTNADIVTNITGTVFVSMTPQTFGYDADGNLTNDGHWTLTWDAENRLVTMESLTSTPPDSRRKLEFIYDQRGRRIQKTVSVWNNSAWSTVLSNRFLYDNWNLIAEIDALAPQQSSLTRAYIWGLDLSGSITGAGGVGGLLMIWDRSTLDNQSSTHFTCYDGNGNVVALLSAENSAITARYEYGPFGEALRATGPMAKANPFRFSTKYQDDETDLLYYGYRFLNNTTGKWLGRDPISERGGRNLYAFAQNSPINLVDLLGLKLLDAICCRDECPADGQVRIDKVSTMILPASVDPNDYARLQIELKLLGRTEKATSPIDVNLVNHVLPDVEHLFNHALEGLFQKEFAFIYTTVDYSVCQKVPCWIRWNRLKWVQYPTSGPKKYATGADDPSQGYSGLGDAEQHLDDAISAHVADIQKNPLQIFLGYALTK